MTPATDPHARFREERSVPAPQTRLDKNTFTDRNDFPRFDFRVDVPPRDGCSSWLWSRHCAGARSCGVPI
jgi:hypothetical protein